MQRLHRLSLLPALLLLSVLAGCQTNPFRTAQTAEQKGDAVYGVYVIAKEQGAELLKDATIPDAAKRPLAEAMVASAEPAGQLQDAVTAYSAVASADNAQKITAALAAAQPLINRLVTALVKVKPAAQPLLDQLEEVK